MKAVRLHQSFVGQDHYWPTNSIQNLEDAEAKRLVDAGFASYVEEVEKPKEKRVVNPGSKR